MPASVLLADPRGQCQLRCGQQTEIRDNIDPFLFACWGFVLICTFDDQPGKLRGLSYDEDISSHWIDIFSGQPIR